MEQEAEQDELTMVLQVGHQVLEVLASPKLAVEEVQVVAEVVEEELLALLFGCVEGAQA